MNNGQKLELKRARLDNRLTSGWQGGKGPFVTFWEWIASGKIVLDADVDYLNYQPFPSKIDQHIAVVCGYKDVDDMALNYRDETDALLEKLCGPHGWAVYKACLARRE